MPIKAVIFDVGGVLLEWSPRALYHKHFPRLSASEIDEFLREVDFPDWNLQQDRGRPFSEGVAELSARFPHRASLIRAYHEHWPDCIPGPIRGMQELIQTLKKNRIGIYGLTNFSAEKFSIARGKYPLFAGFDDVIVSGEVKLVKPDPAIFHLTLRRIGRLAPECVFVDDAATNVATARSMGFAAIQFRDAGHLERELRRWGLVGDS